MCLLIAAERFPSMELLALGDKQNPDGGGIAYLDKGKVVWEKGLSYIDFLDFKFIEGPMLIHFRMATVGEPVPELTHPFPVTKGVELNTKGETDVVFAHNGHVHEWKELLLPAIDTNNPLPGGEYWSDSRAMAFLVHRYGENFLNLITGQKFATLSRNGIKRWGSWHKYDDKIWTSYDPSMRNEYYDWFDNEEDYALYNRYYRSPQNEKVFGPRDYAYTDNKPVVLYKNNERDAWDEDYEQSRSYVPIHSRREIEYMD